MKSKFRSFAYQTILTQKDTVSVPCSLRPSRDCLNFLHAAWKHAGYFFYKTTKNPGACMETFCRIRMQPPLFELKLKT